MSQHGLLFPFKEFIDECDALRDYAGDVLDPRSIHTLHGARTALETLRGSTRTSSIKWGIQATDPLRTIWSDGESQPDSRSGHKLRAEFSFVWEIRKFNENGFAKDRFFLLDGIASTLTSIWDESGDAERLIARWAIDVGDQNSPGTHFHLQIKGDREDAMPYPKSLDIPRFPTLFMSPFLAVELALGELFQDRWKTYATTPGRHVDRWRSIHAARLLRFFEWQKNCISNSAGSPLIHLKLAKPPRELMAADR